VPKGRTQASSLARLPERVLIIDIIGCLISAAIGFWIGQSWAKARRVIRDSSRKPVKYRILSITYQTENKTAELGRFLWAAEFDDWHDAQAEAKKRTDEDTLKNKFDTEYTVVEAP
jgi:hypothetical protein